MLACIRGSSLRSWDLVTGAGLLEEGYGPFELENQVLFVGVEFKRETPDDPRPCEAFKVQIRFDHGVPFGMELTRILSDSLSRHSCSSSRSPSSSLNANYNQISRTLLIIKNSLNPALLHQIRMFPQK